MISEMESKARMKSRWTEPEVHSWQASYVHQQAVCMYVWEYQNMPHSSRWCQLQVYSKLQRNEVSIFMVGLHYKIGQHLNEFGTHAPQAINRLPGIMKSFVSDLFSTNEFWLPVLFYAIGYFLQQYDIYKKCIGFIVLTMVLWSGTIPIHYSFLYTIIWDILGYVITKFNGRSYVILLRILPFHNLNRIKYSNL